jgi:hypothetical protein
MRRLRLAVGLLCVGMAAYLFVVEVPRTLRALSASAADNDSSITSPVERLVRTGRSLDIPRDLQEAALADMPPGSRYALLVAPSSPGATKVYGIDDVASETIGAFLYYLLLPSVPVDSTHAGYVICWGCDTSPWDGHTTWLFRNDQGVAIGRVNRP